MQETVRELSREVGLYQMVMDTFIPEQYQQLIHSHATWNEDTGEWHLVSNLKFYTNPIKVYSDPQRGIAYAGNNVKRAATPPPDQEHQVQILLMGIPL